MKRTYAIEIIKKSSWLYNIFFPEEYIIEITDGKNDVIIDMYKGFQIETDKHFPKKILFK